MPKMSKNKKSNALVKRLNEFPTTRLTPLRISKLRKGSHLTTPFLEAKDGEQGARAAYPKANPATGLVGLSLGKRPKPDEPGTYPNLKYLTTTK